MEKNEAFSPIEIINLLSSATLIMRIQWCYLPNYLVNNGSNKALMNFTDLFSKTPTPIMVDDIPSIDVMRSYYCEYKGIAFCLMYFSQVLKAGDAATDFYQLMVQRTPYESFGYWSTPEEFFLSPLQKLAELADLQQTNLQADENTFYKVISELQSDVASFDPNTESILTPPPPPPPHKYACVVDQRNNYVDFVLILLEYDSCGKQIERIQHYELQDSEHLLDVLPPNGMIKAHWNGEAWEEAASEEEIAEYRRYNGH